MVTRYIDSPDESVLSGRQAVYTDADLSNKPLTQYCAPNEQSNMPTGAFLHESNSKNRKTGRKESFFSVWALDLFVFVLAIGIFAAIVVILRTNDRQKVPDWGRTITLNALIAVLSTIFRTSIAYVSFEVISQLRWNWISTRMRPMRDLQLFDDASRGVYGSLRLVPLVFIKQPVALIAIAVASISLATGPFVQQAVQTYQCLMEIKDVSPDQASILAAHRINSNLSEYVSGGKYSWRSVLDYRMQLSIQDSIANPSINSNIPSLFKCETGNCKLLTYKNEDENDEDLVSYASVGMCSQCDDTSDLIEGPFEDKYGSLEFRLPIPITSENNETYPMLTQMSRVAWYVYLSVGTTRDLSWARRKLSDELFINSRWSVSNFSILAATQSPCESNHSNASCPLEGTMNCGEKVGYVAATCILYPCLKYYRAAVEGGKLSETVVRSTPLRRQVLSEVDELSLINPNTAIDWKAVQQPCMVNNTLYTAKNISKDTLKSDETVFALNKSYAKEILSGTEGYTNITAPPDCVFTLSTNYLAGIYAQFEQQFNSRCIFGLNRGGQCDGPIKGQDFPFINGLRNNCTTTIDTIRTTVSSITLRITNEMRAAGWGPYHNNKTGATVQAQMLSNELCLEVVWSWLALPAVLCVLCAILLLCILISDSRKKMPIWKGSLLPFLLRNQPGIGALGLAGIEETADRHQLQLCTSSMNDIFVVQTKRDEP